MTHVQKSTKFLWSQAATHPKMFSKTHLKMFFKFLYKVLKNTVFNSSQFQYCNFNLPPESCETQTRSEEISMGSFIYMPQKPRPQWQFQWKTYLPSKNRKIYYLQFLQKPMYAHTCIYTYSYTHTYTHIHTNFTNSSPHPQQRVHDAIPLLQFQCRNSYNRNSTDAISPMQFQ